MEVIKIGKVLVVEFQDNESGVFNEIMSVLKKHHDFERRQIEDQVVFSLPGLEIHPQKRKVYCNHEEIQLTTKEFNLLCLMVENQGMVLTYEQIYKSVWGSDSFGNENQLIGYHIFHLREKLKESLPDASFTIRCVREVGYCFEIKKHS